MTVYEDIDLNDRFYDLHIGSIIKMVAKRRGVSPKKLADDLHCDRGTIYNIFRSQSIDITRLLILSKSLDYNFIEEIYLKRYTFPKVKNIKIVINSKEVMEIGPNEDITISISSLD